MSNKGKTQSDKDITKMAKLDAKTKENPKLQQSTLSDGRISLYLEYYLGRKQWVDEETGKTKVKHDRKKESLVVDEACKDLARLRGASYDSAPFYNPNTAPYEGLTAPMWQAPEIACKPPENEDLTFYRVGKLVEAIERSGVNIVENYGDWLRVGCSIAAEFGEYGRYWYHAISCKSDKYKAMECDRQYSHCLKSCSRSSISTLFWYCKQYGITTY